jgi:hypothetical protein
MKNQYERMRQNSRIRENKERKICGLNKIYKKTT